MIFDSLTFAGLASITPFLLMPLLMGREIIRVEADAHTPDAAPRALRRPTAVGPASATISPCAGA